MRLSREAKLGVTLLLAIVLFTAMALAVGRLNLGSKPVLELRVAYHNVDGLREGAPVRYSGVEVGEVHYIELTPQRVLVGLRIYRDVPIPVDSRFVIVTTGVIGDRHVEIYPGRSEAYIETGTELFGQDPVVMDSLLTELYTSLQTLNNVVTDLSELAASEVLQENLVQSTAAVRDMAVSLNTMLDSANTLALELQGLTQDLSSSDLKTLITDLSAFAAELNQLDVVGTAAGIARFTASLEEIPLEQVAQDIQAFSAQLASFDLSPWTEITNDIQAFASKFEELDLAIVTQAAEDLQTFSAQLAQFPVDELAQDLLEISASAKALPFAEFADGINGVIKDIESLPLSDMAGDVQVLIGDLQNLASELNAIGWAEMAADVNQFTRQLAALDLRTPLDRITADLDVLTTDLAKLDLVGLFEQVEDLIETIHAAASAVDGEEIEAALADISVSAGNIRQLTQDAEVLLGQLSTDAVGITQAAGGALEQLQESLNELHALIGDVRVFAQDLAAEGSTAQSLQELLHHGTEIGSQLQEILESLSPDMTESVMDTMESIQQINTDIQNLKKTATSLKLTGAAGVNYSTQQRISGDLRLSLTKEDFGAYLLLGLKSLGGENQIQVQVGREVAPNMSARVGLTGQHLSLGVNASLSDRFDLGADLAVGQKPQVSLRASYGLTPEWWMTVHAWDFSESSFSWGMEYRF